MSAARRGAQTPWAEQPSRSVLVGPLLVWAALLALLAVNLGLRFLPLGAFKVPLAFAVAVVQVALMAGVFMRLDRSSPLVRLTAGAGLVWLSFLFIFAGLDVLTRP